MSGGNYLFGPGVVAEHHHCCRYWRGAGRAQQRDRALEILEYDASSQGKVARGPSSLSGIPADLPHV